MAEEGLIAPLAEGQAPDSRYAFLCWDGWDEERDAEDRPVRAAGDRFGIRPDQLSLFLIAAQEARLAMLEQAAVPGERPCRDSRYATGRPASWRAKERTAGRERRVTYGELLVVGG